MESDMVHTLMALLLQGEFWYYPCLVGYNFPKRFLSRFE